MRPTQMSSHATKIRQSSAHETIDEVGRLQRGQCHRERLAPVGRCIGMRASGCSRTLSMRTAKALPSDSVSCRG